MRPNVHNTVPTGLRSLHSFICPTFKVLNDILRTIDNKEYSVAVFVYLVKAFDSVNHSILLNNLGNISLSENCGFVHNPLFWPPAVSEGGEPSP